MTLRSWLFAFPGSSMFFTKYVPFHGYIVRSVPVNLTLPCLTLWRLHKRCYFQARWPHLLSSLFSNARGRSSTRRVFRRLHVCVFCIFPQLLWDSWSKVSLSTVHLHKEGRAEKVAVVLWSMYNCPSSTTPRKCNIVLPTTTSSVSLQSYRSQVSMFQCTVTYFDHCSYLR